jgi:hypothetical protein
VTFRQARREFEREYFRRLLMKHNWVIRRVAIEAGMSGSGGWLRVKLDNLGLVVRPIKDQHEKAA